jgi:predicted ribosome quality control (RQC) complex YloA/Tae2 family protein
MNVFVELPLWGKPVDELGEDEEISAERLREQAEEMYEHLHEVAEIVEKITVLGWKASVAMYELQLELPEEITSADQAEQKLLDLGIDTSLVQISEWSDEDDKV